MAIIKSLRVMMYADHSKVSEGIKKTEEKFARGMARMAKTLALAFAGRQLGRTVVSGIQEAIKMERFAIELAVLSGDGRTMFAELAELAMESPFPIEEWMMGGKRLLGAGVPMERVGHLLTMLGDMAAGTGTNIRELGLVFTQVWAKMKLQGEESLQFMERNISLTKALMKVLGVSRNKLEKMQAAGQITPEDVIKAMEVMTSEGGRLHGMMGAAMMTVEGQLVRMRNAWTWMMVGMGHTVLPALGYLVDTIVELIKGGLVSGAFETMGVIIAGIAYIVGSIVKLFNIINMLTFGWLGYIIGVGLVFAIIAGLAVSLTWAFNALVVATGIWGFIMAKVATLTTIINANITGMTLGLNILISALVVFLVWAFSWLAEQGFGKMLSEFDKAQESAEAIKEAMTAAGGQGPSTALFESKSAITLLNRHQIDVQKEQLRELKEINKAVSTTETEQYDQFLETRRAKRQANAGKLPRRGNGPNFGPDLSGFGV